MGEGAGAALLSSSSNRWPAAWDALPYETFCFGGVRQLGAPEALPHTAYTVPLRLCVCALPRRAQLAQERRYFQRPAGGGAGAEAKEAAGGAGGDSGAFAGWPAALRELAVAWAAGGEGDAAAASAKEGRRGEAALSALCGLCHFLKEALLDLAVLPQGRVEALPALLRVSGCHRGPTPPFARQQRASACLAPVRYMVAFSPGWEGMYALCVCAGGRLGWRRRGGTAPQQGLARRAAGVGRARAHAAQRRRAGEPRDPRERRRCAACARAQGLRASLPPCSVRLPRALSTIWASIDTTVCNVARC